VIRLMTVFAGAALIASAITVAAAEGTAQGTFTVNGKATKLAYACATARPDASDKTKEEVEVILSDVPLTPAVLQDPTPFGLQDLTRANKLHAIKLRIAPPNAVTSTSMYDSAFKMSSVSVVGSNIKVDLKTLDKTTIAGKVYTAKPDNFNDVPYEYAVTFSAPITR
jgi:type 1 fimbria pilin